MDDQSPASAPPADAQGDEASVAVERGYEASIAGAAPPARRGFRRVDLVFGLIVVLLMFALWAPRLGGPIDLRTDAAVYYITGVAIAEGRGYVMTSEPGEISAVQYPPLLPAIVAVHRWAVGSDDPQVLGTALRHTFALIALAYAVAVYAMARQLVAPGMAVVVGVVTTLFLQTSFLSNALFSEIPFALLTMLFIIANRRSERPGRFALAAALGVAAYLLRSAGLALLMAWVGEAALRRMWWQVLLRSAVAIVPVVAWQGYVRQVTSSPEYAQTAYEYQRAPYQFYNVPYGENLALVDSFKPELGQLTAAATARRLGGNLLRVPVAIGHSVSTVRGYYEWVLRDARNWLGLRWLPDWVASVMPLSLGLMVIAGAGVLARRREWFIILYAGASIGLMCLTPWPDQFTRYLTPLTPVLALSLVVFLVEARERVRARFPRAGAALVGVVVALILLMQAYCLVRTARSGTTYLAASSSSVGGGRFLFFGDGWPAYLEAIEWLEGHVQPGEVVALGTPQWGHVAGGYKAVMPPMEIDPIEAQRLMDGVPVSYAIVDEVDTGEITSRYLAPAVEAHPEHWELVYTVPGTQTRVYQRVSGN